MEGESLSCIFDTSSVDENLLMTSRAIDLSMEELQKRRKLTIDSGYDDDFSDSRRDSLNVDSGLTRSSSLDSIGEDDDRAPADHVFKTMADQFQNLTSKLCNDDHPSLSAQPKSLECVDEGSTNTKEKRRRMTPVPGNTPISKLSQRASLQVNEQQTNGRKFLFVKEEDTEDIENYNYEEDFIGPDLAASVCKRMTEKRNSWHGTTEGEKIAKKYHRSLTLTKSKSLDRGSGYTRHRKRFSGMSIPSISFESLSLDHPQKSGLTSQHCTSEGVNGTSSQFYLFNTDSTKNLKPHKCDKNKSNLPAWMQEAEADMTSSDTGSNCSDDEHQPTSIETMSMKLQIPDINWAKLKEAKNKTNKLLSEQRKEKNKLKNKAMSRRRRKLTPSDSPSHSSLEKLTTLKSNAEEWSVAEEEEEEEEEHQ